MQEKLEKQEEHQKEITTAQLNQNRRAQRRAIVSRLSFETI